MLTATRKLLIQQLELFGPDTTEGLAAELGLGPKQLRRVLKDMHTRDLIYIKAYEETPRGPKKPVWAFGYGKDAKPPPRLSGAARQQALRDRRRANRGATIWSNHEIHHAASELSTRESVH